jgi:hypothetical protein
VKVSKKKKKGEKEHREGIMISLRGSGKYKPDYKSKN